MTKRGSRLVLGAMAAVSALMLAAFVVAGTPAKREVTPSWIAAHPADWLAASELTDRALDARLARRFEVWRATHDLAKHVAPRQTNPHAALVRSGLFHWYELSEADRRAVLAAAEPLLRESSATYLSLHRPLWQLTRDFALLRRTNPGDAASLRALAELAAMNGLFDESRALRERLQRQQYAEFQARRAEMTSADLIALTPAPLDRGDEPLVRGILEELQKRSDRRSIELPRRLADYAIRNGIPVEARDTRVFTPTLEWRGTCGANELCHFAQADVIARNTITITATPVQSDEVPPYLELYLDDRLVAHGEVRGPRTFRIATTAGPHHIEAWLANPRTRNGVQRRVRLS